jgi:hypothetical protein
LAATAASAEVAPAASSAAPASNENAVLQRAAVLPDIGCAATAIADEGAGAHSRAAAIVAATRAIPHPGDEYGETLSRNDRKLGNHAATAPAIFAGRRGSAAGGSARIHAN